MKFVRNAGRLFSVAYHQGIYLFGQFLGIGLIFEADVTMLKPLFLALNPVVFARLVYLAITTTYALNVGGGIIAQKIYCQLIPAGA